MASAIDNLKSNINRTVESNQAIQSGVSWYRGLPPRDALIVKGLSILIALSLVYLWVWVPAENYNNRYESKLKSEKELHSYMKANAYKVSGNAQRSNNSGAGQSVLALVNSTSKAKGIALSRFEPEGDDGLRIWLDKVKFDDVIDWIDLLENDRGVRVTQINIDKVDPGTVNLRAVLKR